MGVSKIGGFNAILIISIILLAVNASAETTFFDNPDDAFIMGDFATGGVVISGGTTRRGGCIYEWNCTDWGKCLPSGKQTRNCVNVGTCPDTYEPPEIEQNCTYTAPESGEEENVTEENYTYTAPEAGEEENVTEEEQEKEKQSEIGEIIEEEIVDKNKIPIYSIIILTILSIILYLKKDYFKKLIKKRLCLNSPVSD